MTRRTDSANSPTRSGHAGAANSPDGKKQVPATPSFTGSLSSVHCSLFTVHCVLNHGEHKFPHFRGAIP
jgi:hypothetical protein